MQVYSNPSRESDPHALPDVEVFHSSEANDAFHDWFSENELHSGYYYQFCLPGCLPDSEPVGPFATADEARKAAQQV